MHLAKKYVYGGVIGRLNDLLTAHALPYVEASTEYLYAIRNKQVWYM